MCEVAFLMFLSLLACKLTTACYYFPVSKLWAKKNAVGKEQVAKLVDDTYRSVLETTLLKIFSLSSFGMLQINVKAEICRSVHISHNLFLHLL